jgi:hypothetical protein
LIVGFWQGTLRFGIFKFRLENIKEDDDMVLPDPNLSEQKRRISESLHGIKDIIELIRKAPEKYLPKEEVQSFNESCAVESHSLSGALSLVSVTSELRNVDPNIRPGQRLWPLLRPSHRQTPETRRHPPDYPGFSPVSLKQLIARICYLSVILTEG